MNTARSARMKSTAGASTSCLLIPQSFRPSPQLAVTLTQRRCFTCRSLTAWLYEAGGGGLPWVAIPAVSRPWMHPRSYLRWFLSDLIRTHQFRILARDERLNASAFDLILVNSYFSRESLLRAYGLDSTVCYLGVDTQLFVNHQYARENFVVSVGELSPHKNVEFVINAVAQIAAPRPRLVWIANRGSRTGITRKCEVWQNHTK